MPKLDNLQRLPRIDERIRQLERGEEVAARDIKNLLTAEEYAVLDTELEAQRQLKLTKRPAALAGYERQWQQATAMISKCKAAEPSTVKQRVALLSLQHKCATALARAQHILTQQLEQDSGLAQWLDRQHKEAASTLELLGSDDLAALNANNQVLNELWKSLPVLVSSRSSHKLISVEQRFGWQTIRETRLEVLRGVASELRASELVDLRDSQQQREARAARVYMAAWAEAHENEKDGHSAGNIALQRNGFRTLDTGLGRRRTQREIEVEAIEAKLTAKAEAEMTDDEREQLAMQRRHDAYVAKWRKSRGF
jgi:hypothetical protein